MSVVGIDVSMVSTGLARISPDGIAYTWTATSVGRRHDTITERSHRLRTLAAEVVGTVHDDDCVVIEAPSHGSVGGSVWDRAGLWWLIVARLTARDIPVIAIAPMSRAKWATGSGKSDKAAVATAIGRLFPDVDITCSDEADALILAHAGAVALGYTVPAKAHHTLGQLPKGTESWTAGAA